MAIYYAEVTDLFCGEMNYSWISRFHVKATSPLGAIRKIARHYNLNFRSHSEGIYHSTSKLTGVFIEEVDTSLPIDYYAEEI
jgi:hypothetical protein